MARLTQDQFLLECIDEALSPRRETMFGAAKAVARNCESPIEERLLFAMAFMEVPVYFQADDWLTRPVLPQWVCPDMGKYDEWVKLEAQAPVLSYRADFLITAKFYDRPDKRMIVVECDGHDFHERTKDQAARDKKRDRAMTTAGFSVLRFTGSEIHRDASACAKEVSKLLTKMEWETRPE